MQRTVAVAGAHMQGDRNKKVSFSKKVGKHIDTRVNIQARHLSLPLQKA